MTRRLDRIAWSSVLCAALLHLSAAHALELGTLQVDSTLGERLDARLAIVSTNGNDLSRVRVSLADVATYERFGVPRSDVLSSIDVALVERDGEGAFVRIRSSEAIHELFLSVLLEIDDDDVQLVREVAFLLDPSVLPVARTRNADTGRAADTAAGTGRTYTVATGDSLMRIAQRFTPPSASAEQTAVAFYETNPEAFLGSIHRLIVGARLSVPDEATVRSRSPRAAKAVIRDGIERFRRRLSDAAADTAESAPAGTRAPVAGRSTEDAPDEATSAAGTPVPPVEDDLALQDFQAVIVNLKGNLHEMQGTLDERIARLDTLHSQLDELIARRVRIRERAERDASAAREAAVTAARAAAAMSAAAARADETPAGTVPGGADDAPPPGQASAGDLSADDLSADGRAVDGAPAAAVPEERRRGGTAPEPSGAEVPTFAEPVLPEPGAPRGTDEPPVAAPSNATVPPTRRSPSRESNSIVDDFWTGTPAAGTPEVGTDSGDGTGDGTAVPVPGASDADRADRPFAASGDAPAKPADRDGSSRVVDGAAASVAAREERRGGVTGSSGRVATSAGTHRSAWTLERSMQALRDGGLIVLALCMIHVLFSRRFRRARGVGPEGLDVHPDAALDFYLRASGTGYTKEQLLKSTLQDDPGRQDLRLRLLELYAEKGSMSLFAEEAQIMYRMTRGNTPEWYRVVQLGLELDAGIDFYRTAIGDDPFDMALDLGLSDADRVSSVRGGTDVGGRRDGPIARVASFEEFLALNNTVEGNDGELFEGMTYPGASAAGPSENVGTGSDDATPPVVDVAPVPLARRPVYVPEDAAELIAVTVNYTYGVEKLDFDLGDGTDAPDEASTAAGPDTDPLGNVEFVEEDGGLELEAEPDADRRVDTDAEGAADAGDAGDAGDAKIAALFEETLVRHGDVVAGLDDAGPAEAANDGRGEGGEELLIGLAFHTDDVELQLSLAETYADNGWDDEARELIAEALTRADEIQHRRAVELLERLGGSLTAEHALG